MNSIDSLQPDGIVDELKQETEQPVKPIIQNVNDSGKVILDTKILKHEKSKPDKSKIIITLFELSEFIKIPEDREILAS